MKPHFLASCYGKIKFDTYDQAKAAAESLGSAVPYKCRYGDHFHRGRKDSK